MRASEPVPGEGGGGGAPGAEGAPAPTHAPAHAPARASAVAALAAALTGAAGGGEGPSAAELAELLWLARHLPPPPEPEDPPGAAGDGTASHPSAPGAPGSGALHATAPTDLTRPPAADPAAPHDLAARTAPSDPTTPDTPASPHPGRTPPATDPAPPADSRVPLHLPAEGHRRDATGDTPTGPEAGPTHPTRTAVDGTVLHVPVPPMIAHPLALQRALRPLGRRVPAPVGRVLDEEATAHRIATLGAHPRGWLPVLRPAEERWLRLCLVHDDGPTMPVWRPLVRELHAALAQSGLFRTVELHRAGPDGRVAARAAAAPAAGRTVVLLVSDCMGPQWREGGAGRRWYRTLRHWASRLPLAVLQPLPERLWSTTALPATPGLFAAPHAAAPTATYTFEPFDPDAEPSAVPPDALPVPVLDASPRWLANWSSLVADAGGRRLPGSVGWLASRPAAALARDGVERADVTLLSPQDLVLRFRSTASPEAFRLAGHLAVGEPHLPVMRLVQAAVERHPRAQHLAEVILSGMLTGTPDGPPGSYAFRDGVREVLLGTVPRSARGRTRQLLARVGALIDERAGVAPGELRAVARGAGGSSTVVEGEPFAAVSAESVRQLSGAADEDEGALSRLIDGRYRVTGRFRHGQDLCAQDTRQGDRTVVVARYRDASPDALPRFEALRHALSGLRHPNVAALLGDGDLRGVPHLVLEHHEGETLHAALDRHRGGLPVNQPVDVARQLALGVQALHTHGIAHGQLSARCVVLADHGPVLYGFGRLALDDTTRAADLRDLGHLVHLMRTGDWLTRPEQLALPLGADHALPEHLERELRQAVADLVAEDPALQTRGAQRLEQLDMQGEHRRHYGLLGPLRVTRGGSALAVDSPQEQAMLCMLLLREGDTVHESELVAGLWKTPGPDGGRLVRTYASRLRNALGPRSVTRRGDGYALLVAPGDIDVVRCRRLAAEAEQARGSGDFARARALVESALGLWRGEPLSGVPGPAARTTRTWLRLTRMALLRSRAELDLETEDFDRAVTGLQAALDEFPHDIDLLRLHLVALKGQGRIDEAITAYEEYRTLRLAELGTEPPAVLRELRQELGGLRAAETPALAPTTFSFSFTTSPGWQADTLMKLSRTVARLLTQGGATAEQFELLPRERGWDAVVSAEVPRAALLRAILHELPFTVGAYAGLGLLVTVTGAPDPAGPPPADVSDVHGGEAVVMIPGDVHDELYREDRADLTRFVPVPGSTDWICRVGAVSARPGGVFPALSDTLDQADTVVLGFDGTLTRLYAPGKAREAALRLLALVVERRDPEAALGGVPLPRAGGGSEYVHPLDVLRAFAAEGPLAADLADQLDRIERQAVFGAKPVPHATALVRLLADGTGSGPGPRPRTRPRAVCLVTDTAPRAVATYVATHELTIRADRIHCRTGDLSRLLPDPEGLRRVLARPGVTADRCLMIGSTVAEATAARALDVPFVGYAPDDRTRERLLAAGARHTVSTLSQLVDAVRRT
ncbi:SAV_2336 N-terminal domain-related protein [Streptomyces alboflavus]|uniref:SAV_2336 N-terminal domain-related protein n=1 Tax=Streptomyces alboflavus TaxID=67267 RepID=UPI001386844F|nr:SAV_2336 N-terminal domain-related protein [Streptomyces alboflavus]